MQVIVCPKWTQWAFLHKFLSEKQIQNMAFSRLICNRPYSWRYIPGLGMDGTGSLDNDRPCLVHWQVTINDVPKKQQALTTESDDEQKFNRSIYLIAPSQYPKYYDIIDHRGNSMYLIRLAIFAAIAAPKTPWGLVSVLAYTMSVFACAAFLVSTYN
jgi:hypothetical protein